MDSLQKLTKKYKDIIIENITKAMTIEYVLLNNKVVAVSKRIPPYIIGDGIKSINQLINDLNSDERRGEDHESTY